MKKVVGWAMVLSPVFSALGAALYFAGPGPVIAAIISVVVIAVPFAMIGYGAKLIIEHSEECKRKNADQK